MALYSVILTHFSGCVKPLSREESIKLKNSVYEELAGDDFLKSLFLLAFESYDGFEQY